MKKLLIFAFAVFAFAACTQNDVEELSANRADVPETLTVGFEGDDTRIQLNEAQKTVWNAGDEVSVFYRSNANQKWQYQGETGERVGNLKRVDNIWGTLQTTKTIVVYPYSENYWLNTDSYYIDATLPAVQHYAEDSYGVGENLMVSQSEFTQFSLKSVCGWLKLNLTGNGEVVKEIIFRGNSNEQVAGLIYVDTATAESTLASEMGSADDNNAGGNLIFDNTIVTELTLDCGEGVVLGAEATAFYIAVPPQTFEQGVAVEILCDGYKPMTLATTYELIIERNHIKPMEVVEFEAEPDTEYIIKYLATEKVAEHEAYPWTFDTFGANVLSHTWDAETGEGVIAFDGKVTKITDKAFKECNAITGIYLPETITSITNEAFVGCGNIDKVYIDNLDKYYALEMDHPSSGPLFNQADLYVNNELFTEWEIPGEIISINKNFIGCTSLNTVILHDDIEYFADSAFYMCDNLKKVYINSLDSWYKIDFPSEWSRPQRGGADVYVGNELFTEWIVPADHDGVGQWFRGCGSLERIVIDDSTTVIGTSALASCHNLESVVWGGVVQIDDWAFWDCKSLTNLTFNDNLEIIRTNAFRECTALESVTFGNNVKVIHHLSFLGCSNLQSVTFRNNVTLIDGEAFAGCNLETVVLPASLNHIGVKAFNDNPNLKTVYCSAIIPPTTDIGNQGDTLWFGFGDSVESIYVPVESFYAYQSAVGWKEYADKLIPYDFEKGEVVDLNKVIFYTATAKVEAHSDHPWTFDTFGADIVSHDFNEETGEGIIIFDGDVTTIGDFAFDSCSSLTSVIIPDSVTTIGYVAFGGCDSLTSVTIGDSVTTIGQEAFCNCYRLTSVTIGDSVTTIGLNAFSHCDSLTSITIPDSVTTIGARAFSECYRLTSVTIGDSVTTIGGGAFDSCSSLTSVTIPDSVTTIGGGAFCDCDSLTEFNGKFASEDGRCLIVDGTLNSFAIGCGATEYTIPDSVTTIGVAAFDSCDSLTSITIPDSVTTIEAYAFSNCSSLTSIYCEATTPPSFGYDALNTNASERLFYVPAASVETYKTAMFWRDYADYIVGYDFENGVVVE